MCLVSMHDKNDSNERGKALIFKFKYYFLGGGQTFKS